MILYSFVSANAFKMIFWSLVNIFHFFFCKIELSCPCSASVWWKFLWQENILKKPQNSQSLFLEHFYNWVTILSGAIFCKALSSVKHPVSNKISKKSTKIHRSHFSPAQYFVWKRAPITLKLIKLSLNLKNNKMGKCKYVQP